MPTPEMAISTYVITKKGTERIAHEVFKCAIRHKKHLAIVHKVKIIKELSMHLEVYKIYPEVKAVLHASPFYSTFCACCDFDMKTNLFIEFMYYDENIKFIPYFHAGSKELAKTVADVCEDTRVILMRNHGILVYDGILKECRSALEVTENICKMNIMAQIRKHYA